MKKTMPTAYYILLIAMMMAFLPKIVLAASLGVGGGTGFQAFYNFIYNASSGYLGRGIVISGSVIGLGTAAVTGKALPAVIGVFLVIFAMVGPTIINALLTSATI